MLSFEELRAEVEAGAIDTVVVAFTDMQGRLLGKRLHGEFFCDEVSDEHTVKGITPNSDPIRAEDLAGSRRASICRGRHAQK